MDQLSLTECYFRFFLFYLFNNEFFKQEFKLKLPGGEHELVTGERATPAHESDVWEGDVSTCDKGDGQVVAEGKSVRDAEVETLLFTAGLTVGVVDFLKSK